MNKIAIVMALFFVTSAAAQDAKQCAAQTKDPLGCLVSTANAELFLCSVSMSTALLNGGADLQCGIDLRAKIAPYYELAKKSASKNKETTALLKDYFAAWNSTLDGLVPGVGETKGAYSRRVDAAQRSLNEKGERLKLEK